MRKNEVNDTGIPGIKQRIKDGKYLVTLDLGRQLRMNKKTGQKEMRQVKTTYTYSTLKEAKAALGRNANKKQQREMLCCAKAAVRKPIIR